jgi:hypothetical protein
MNNRTIVAAMTVAIGLVGSAYASRASACALADLRGARTSAQTASFAQFASGIRATQQGTPGVSAASLLGSNPRRSIVGFWRFAFTAPDGVTGIDWGFQSWHDDGTEITNSGGQLPATGNFCTGVWEQHVGGGYHLNHWAIAWNLPGTDPADLVGLINIREVVNLDRSGNSMTGSVSLDLYAVDGTTFMAHVGDGTVSGTRITP